MRLRIHCSTLILAAVLSFGSTIPRVADATIVEFQFEGGDRFQVNLYDNATPETVANFLRYVQSGDYSGSIIHRSEPGFVIQGGGFTGISTQTDTIPRRPPIINEPVYSNVRGTIAMAKLASGPDTATSQWYFNLNDNSRELDGQNGGFTVFGEVTVSGMDVIDAIAALPTFSIGSPFDDIPLQNYRSPDPIEDANLVTIRAIVVTDTTVDSAAGLDPERNRTDSGGKKGGGGGGSFGFFGLLGLLLVRRIQSR